LRCNPGFGRVRTKFVSSSLPHSGLRARAHRRTRTRSTPARCLSAPSLAAISCKAFRSSSFRCWSCGNAVVSRALTPKTKKPGALARSGPVKTRQLSLAISPAGTCAVLTEFPVMRHRALAAWKQGRSLRCVRCKSYLHNSSMRRARILHLLPGNVKRADRSMHLTLVKTTPLRPL
jgi:hypothetical protein